MPRTHRLSREIGKSILIELGIIIFVVFLVSWLFGCASHASQTPVFPSYVTPIRQVTADYLKRQYENFNISYFEHKLPPDVTIKFGDAEGNMALTECNSIPLNCTITFNLRFVAAPRVADFTMLHEQCHIKTWGSESKENDPHGKKWRACMLALDEEGAFRNILIDNFGER